MEEDHEELPVKVKQLHKNFQGARLSPAHFANPTVGVKSDFEKLLTSFTETKSVRYEEFSKIWKSMKMSMIFAGRQSDMEVREFVEDCMNIALNFLMPPYNFQVRVGALYIVYGLYWKQPCRPMAKIRITQEQWKELQHLMEEVKAQQHLDVEYVYTVLEYNSTFKYVATSTPMYPNMRDVVDDDTKLLKMDAMAVLAEQKSILSEILEPDNIDQLSAIHEQYHRLKCLLNETDKSKPKASMDVIKPSLVQYITKSVAAYEEKRKVITGKKPRKRHDSKDSGQTTTSESEPESDVDNPDSPSKRQKKLTTNDGTGTRRAEIKARAFAVVEQVSKSRRHRQVLTESQSEDGFSSPSFSSPSPKKNKKLKPAKNTSGSSNDKTNVDTSDISSWGNELRNSLLSMPLLQDIEEPKVQKKKKLKQKKSKVAPPEQTLNQEDISPATKRKGKRKQSSTSEMDTTQESLATPKSKVKRKSKMNEVNSSDLGSPGNVSMMSGVTTPEDTPVVPATGSGKRRRGKASKLTDEQTNGTCSDEVLVTEIKVESGESKSSSGKQKGKTKTRQSTSTKKRGTPKKDIPEKSKTTPRSSKKKTQ